MGQLRLAVKGGVDQLLAPVEGTDNIFRPVGAKLADGCRRLVRVWLQVVIVAVDANGEPAGGGDKLALPFLAEGNAVIVQRHVGEFLAGGAEVPHVVVGGCDKVHAALVQDLGVIGGSQEGELLK